MTGTSFNLSAYAEDRDAEITLVNGSVELLDLNRGDKMRMKPRQLARYIPGNTSFDVEDNVDTDLYTAWRDGILVFDNVDLQQFIRKIERWYGVEIVIGDTKLLNYTYTGKFKEETIRQVLELMKQTSDLDYKISDKEITLTLKKK